MGQKKYFLSVGEPWNFNSPDGENIINGFIIKVLSDTCLLFKANYILNFNGISGDIFVICPRYTKENFIGLEKENYYQVINGSLLVGDFDENETQEVLKEKSILVIAGGIKN